MPLDGADTSVTTLLGRVVELQWRLGARICKGAYNLHGVSAEPVAALLARRSLTTVNGQSGVTKGSVNETTTGSGIPKETRRKGDAAEGEEEQK